MARHRRLVDVAMGFTYLALALLSAVNGNTSWDTAYQIALSVVTATAIVFRRRWPVVSFAVVLAMSLLGWPRSGNADPVALPISLYALAVYRSAAAAWFGLAAVAVVSIPAALVFSDSVDRWVGTTFVMVFTLVGATIGMSVGSRRRYVDALIERAHQLEREREQREALAASAERTRIAREMHDIVAHSLSVMITLADGAGVMVRRDPDKAAGLLDQVADTGRSALADMRRVLGLLRDPIAPLAPQPTSADLGSIIETFRRSGLPVQLTTTGDSLPSDAGLQLAVFRVIQESLTNVLRYAPGAATVKVAIAHADGMIDLVVDDSGDPSGVHRAITGAGHGILGMHERAAVYAGTVEAGPRGAGWRVHATMKWTEEE